MIQRQIIGRETMIYKMIKLQSFLKIDFVEIEKMYYHLLEAFHYTIVSACRKFISKPFHGILRILTYIAIKYDSFYIQVFILNNCAVNFIVELPKHLC